MQMEMLNKFKCVSKQRHGVTAEAQSIDEMVVLTYNCRASVFHTAPGSIEVSVLEYLHKEIYCCKSAPLTALTEGR